MIHILVSKRVTLILVNKVGRIKGMGLSPEWRSKEGGKERMKKRVEEENDASRKCHSNE